MFYIRELNVLYKEIIYAKKLNALYKKMFYIKELNALCEEIKFYFLSEFLIFIKEIITYSF